MEDNKVIVCRCEDVTKAEIEEEIEEGYTTIDELKRLLRCGMGPCRGRTCIPMIRRILANKLGKDVAEVDTPKDRPPIMATKFESVLEGAEDG